jgi:hypothetical protein
MLDRTAERFDVAPSRLVADGGFVPPPIEGVGRMTRAQIAHQ